MAWKVLENSHGLWKSLNLCLKVLERAWIRFSKTLWPKKWLHLVEGFRGPETCLECVVGRGSSPDPAGGAHDAFPDSLDGWGGDTFAYISFVWSLKVLEKTLSLILTNGQEPCKVPLIIYSSYLWHFFYVIQFPVWHRCFSLLLWCNFKSRSTETRSDLTFVHECTA